MHSRCVCMYVCMFLDVIKNKKYQLIPIYSKYAINFMGYGQLHSELFFP